MIYFCGNSLGLQPKAARDYVQEVLETWAELGVEGHFQGKHPWKDYHEFVTPYLAYLCGAQESEVVAANTLTVNLHLLFVSFYRPIAGRYKIIMEPKPFPSDLYLAQSQLRFHGYDPEQGILFPPHDHHGRTTLDDLLATIHAHKDEIALIFISPVNYYNGNYLPIEAIAQIGQEYDIPVGLDLAHTIGNIPLRLHEWGVDFAAWCSYKYLNGGPGAIGGYFVHEKYHRSEAILQFAGWWGHDKTTRFQMPPSFQPIPTSERWQLSNPPILSLAPLLASLPLFQEANMNTLRQISLEMTDYLIQHLRDLPQVELITDTDPQFHGCQLSLVIPEGKRIFSNLLQNGIIVDWREPDVIRIAPTPLYNTKEDLDQFLTLLKHLIQ